jgi:hypothetical protein
MQKSVDNQRVLTQFRRRRGGGAPRGSFGLWGDKMQQLLLREEHRGEASMAKRRKRRYSRSAGSEVKREMHRYKRGTARSGRGGRGGRVKSRKQAIAIGLSKARKKGKKVPKKRA